MIGQDLIATGIYLISAFVLFWIGKLVKDLTTTSYSVREELVEKDNAALGVAMAGYYFGLILAIGGTLSGPSQGLEKRFDRHRHIRIAGDHLAESVASGQRRIDLTRIQNPG